MASTYNSLNLMYIQEASMAPMRPANAAAQLVLRTQAGRKEKEVVYVTGIRASLPRMSYSCPSRAALLQQLWNRYGGFTTGQPVRWATAAEFPTSTTRSTLWSTAAVPAATAKVQSDCRGAWRIRSFILPATLPTRISSAPPEQWVLRVSCHARHPGNLSRYTGLSHLQISRANNC